MAKLTSHGPLNTGLPGFSRRARGRPVSEAESYLDVWAVPGSNGRPTACKARATAAVRCGLSLSRARRAIASRIPAALCRGLPLPEQLPHASEFRLAPSTPPGRRMHDPSVVNYPLEWGVPSPSSDEAPKGGTDAIGTLQMGHGPPALCERGRPIRGRRPSQLAERDCRSRRAPRPPDPDFAAVVPADRRARRGGGLGPRARRGGDESRHSCVAAQGSPGAVRRHARGCVRSASPSSCWCSSWRRPSCPIRSSC